MAVQDRRIERVKIYILDKTSEEDDEDESEAKAKSENE